LCAPGAAIQSASARGSGMSGCCSLITTRAGAVTSAGRASAGVWLVRVVGENALAYRGRRRLATTWLRYAGRCGPPGNLLPAGPERGNGSRLSGHPCRVPAPLASRWLRRRSRSAPAGRVRYRVCWAAGAKVGWLVSGVWFAGVLMRSSPPVCWPGSGTRRGGRRQLLRCGCPSGRSRGVCRRVWPAPTAAGG
jgi:hypothetical protein